jgi:HD-GYP domain-containing protein (c-di-GMP phosphodiesterase class II)
VNELARAFNLAAKSVADSQRQLDEAYLQITQTMAQTLDARDPYTAGHSSRVSDYSVAIAEAMNLSASEVDVIRTGANFHDIGKIGIPDAVLQKPGPLTEAEFGVIKRHPVIGKRILEGVAKFHDYLSIVELHHENHDGTGYPWGLRGDNVPLEARIVHVVDAYDAMTTNRPYRPALSHDQAVSIIRTHSGTQFDPAVVEVFLRLVQSSSAILESPAISGGGSSTAELQSLARSLGSTSKSNVEEAVS